MQNEQGIILSELQDLIHTIIQVVIEYILRSVFLHVILLEYSKGIEPQGTTIVLVGPSIFLCMSRAWALYILPLRELFSSTRSWPTSFSPTRRLSGEEFSSRFVPSPPKHRDCL